MNKKFLTSSFAEAAIFMNVASLDLGIKDQIFRGKKTVGYFVCKRNKKDYDSFKHQKFQAHDNFEGSYEQK